MAPVAMSNGQFRNKFTHQTSEKFNVKPITPVSQVQLKTSKQNSSHTGDSKNIGTLPNVSKSHKQSSIVSKTTRIEDSPKDHYADSVSHSNSYNGARDSQKQNGSVVLKTDDTSSRKIALGAKQSTDNNSLEGAVIPQLNLHGNLIAQQSRCDVYYRYNTKTSRLECVDRNGVTGFNLKAQQTALHAVIQTLAKAKQLQESHADDAEASTSGQQEWYLSEAIRRSQLLVRGSGSQYRSKTVGIAAIEGSQPQTNLTRLEFTQIVKNAQRGVKKPLLKAHPLGLNMAFMTLAHSEYRDRVRWLLEFMIENNRTNQHTFGAALLAQHAAHGLQGAIDMWHDLMQRGIDIGPIASSAFLKLLGLSRDLNLAEHCFHEMVASGVTLTVHAFNTMAHIYGLMGRPDGVKELMDGMEGLEDPMMAPDMLTYCSWLHASMRSQRRPVLVEAVRVTAAKVESGEITGVDTRALCLMLTAASQAGDGDAARTMFQTCVSQGCPLNVQTYNNMLGVLTKYGSLEEVQNMYKTMLDNGITPDAYTFSALFAAASRFTAPAEYTHACLREMYARNVAVNTIIGSAILNAYRRCREIVWGTDAQVTKGIVTRARDLLNVLHEADLANGQTYSCMAALYAATHSPQLALTLLEEAEANRIFLEPLAFTLVISALEDTGHLSHAAKLKEAVKTKRWLMPEDLVKRSKSRS